MEDLIAKFLQTSWLAGWGMFTLLDASLSNQGLVRLSSTLDYWNPVKGPPARVSFLDERSQESNRLFGQGAQIQIRNYVVSTLPRD